ncbi:glycoside hydrolase N-terminal domain-containing protein [Promicromonospora sp. NPDC057488]|uniref:glycosyl hydrolase family 95 catalytic domain-containing protein n=1 Tax=Promicromonospora sp. NPDC057488 TaxID=3346147 RepID=UPI003670482F
MPSQQIWFDAPAHVWTEALPLGNGRLGAMAFGGVVDDRFQLNEDSAWSGAPASAGGAPGLAGDDGPAVLAEARALVAAGAVRAAEEVVKRLQRGHSQAYQPVGDLWIRSRAAAHPAGSRPEGYRRWLDLATATTGQQWRSGAMSVTQEAMISHPHQVLAIRRRSVGGLLDLEVGLAGAHPSPELLVGTGTALLVQRLPSDVFPPHEKVPEPVVYDDAPGASATVVTGMRLLTDGVTSVEAGGLRVTGATEVVVLLAVHTDVDVTSVVPVPLRGDRERLAASVRATLDAAAELPFDELRGAHVTDHARMYGRVELDLHEPAGVAGLTTPARLERSAASGDDPALAALAFRYGRYLMIAGSRPGTVPLNLQGIWSDAVRPPWSSNFTTNINLQMNYWPAHPANLDECAAPLHAFLRRLQARGAVVAREMYDADGWVVHHNADLWGFAWPVGEGTLDPRHAAWQLGSVWLAQSIWEHHAFTGDIDQLRHMWPVLRGAVQFGLDWLVPDGRGGLMTSPSTSPENTYLLPDGSPAALTVSTTADMALLQELFQQCLAAMDVLDVEDDELAATVRDALARLPRPRVMPDGRFAEWPTDVADAEPDHRHQSHLVGLYPGTSINIDRRPDLAAAARASLTARGPESTGWALAWRLALRARLRDPQGAEACLAAYLRPTPAVPPGQVVSEGGGVYPNLLCAHPPFQIDGNFGFVAGVVELLLQSHQGELHLLPCLPETWRDGAVRGLRARGGIEVDIEWRDGVLAEARLRADRDSVVRVRTAGEVVSIALAAGRRVGLDARLQELAGQGQNAQFNV